jgi:hypothetical protein
VNEDNLKINMVKKKLYGYSNLLALILGLIFCTITYGPVGIIMAIIAQIVMGIILLFGFIPVFGVVIYIWLIWFNFLPWLVAAFGVEWSWSLTVLFAFNLIISIGCTLQAIIRIFTVYWRF